MKQAGKKLIRISIQVDPDIADRLNNEIRHGFRGHLVGGLLTLALNAIEKDGDIMLGALIAGKYRLVPDLGDMHD